MSEEKLSAIEYATKYNLIKYYNSMKKLKEKDRVMIPFNSASGGCSGKHYKKLMILLRIIRQEETGFDITTAINKSCFNCSFFGRGVDDDYKCFCDSKCHRCSQWKEIIYV